MKCSYCEFDMPPNKLKCTSCGNWNIENKSIKSNDNIIDLTVLLSDVKSIESERLDIGLLNKVWGGGLVPTSVTLIGGAPGAGKSTLMLQLLNTISELLKQEVVYIAAEESLPEIKARADRLQLEYQKYIRMVPALGGIFDLATILVNRKPKAIVIDSLKGLVGGDDSAAEETCKIAKEYAIGLKSPVIITQHVNKEELIAGEMSLQHVVDTTMTFFADSDTKLRELQVLKNRNGEALISQYFIMDENGLTACEINPDEDDEDDEDDGDDEDDEYIPRKKAKR